MDHRQRRGDASTAEARSAFADAERREAEPSPATNASAPILEYLESRQSANANRFTGRPAKAKQAAIASGPIGRDNAYMVYKAASDLERLRFGDPRARLEFQECRFEAGKPVVTR